MTTMSCNSPAFKIVLLYYYVVFFGSLLNLSSLYCNGNILKFTVNTGIDFDSSSSCTYSAQVNCSFRTALHVAASMGNEESDVIIELASSLSNIEFTYMDDCSANVLINPSFQQLKSLTIRGSKLPYTSLKLGNILENCPEANLFGLVNIIPTGNNLKLLTLENLFISFEGVYSLVFDGIRNLLLKNIQSTTPISSYLGTAGKLTYDGVDGPFSFFVYTDVQYYSDVYIINSKIHDVPVCSEKSASLPYKAAKTDGSVLFVEPRYFHNPPAIRMFLNHTRFYDLKGPIWGPGRHTSSNGGASVKEECTRAGLWAHDIFIAKSVAPTTTLLPSGCISGENNIYGKKTLFTRHCGHFMSLTDLELEGGVSERDGPDEFVYTVDYPNIHCGLCPVIPEVCNYRYSKNETSNYQLFGYDCALNKLHIESISGCEITSNGKTYDCDINSTQTITIEGRGFHSSEKNITIDDVRIDLGLSGTCDVIKVEQNRILCNLSFHNVNLGSRNGVIRVCILNGSCSNDLLLGFKNPKVDTIGSLGTTKGGTLVSITGNHFGPLYVQASLNVIIGNVEINATLENYNLITFVSPPGFGMNKSIQVIIQDSKLELTSDYFSPVVSKVTCAPTNQNGGTIQFKGSEFGISNPPDGFVITFEIIKQDYVKSNSKTITCLNPTWVSFSELTCFFPEEGIGIDVGNVLITSSGYNVVVDKGLCFKEPHISDISPQKGRAGEVVTIVGTGFGTFTGIRGLISVSFLSKNGGEIFSCFAGCGNTTTSSSHSCLVTEGYGSNLSVILKLGNVEATGNVFFSYFHSNSTKALIRSFYPHFGTVWGGTEVILSTINVNEGDVCNFHITLGTDVSIFTSKASILNITSGGIKTVQCITPFLRNIDFSLSEKALIRSRFSISNSDAHDFYFYVSRNANFFCSSKMTSYEGPISGKQTSGETVKVGVSSFELKNIIGMVPQYELPFLSNGIFCIFSAKNISKMVKAELQFGASGYSFVCPLPHFSKRTVAEVKVTINNQDLFSLSPEDDGIHCNQSTNFSFVECPRGTYAELPELPCLPCPLDSFASFQGSSRCQPCPVNSFTREKGSKSIDECFCPENSCKVELLNLLQFSEWNDTAACITCEENLKCSSHIWRKAKCPPGTLFMNNKHSIIIDNHTSSTSFYSSNSLISSCPSKLGCFGGDNVHTCRIGFTGTGCLKCIDGYGEFGVPTTCWKCNQGAKYLGFICYLLIPSIIILVSFKSSKNSSRNIPILLKMFSNHVMILMSVSCLPFKYPTWLYSMFNVFTIFGGIGTPGGHSDSETGGLYSYSEENGFTGLGSLFSLDCIMGFHFYSQETRFDAKTTLYAVYPFILVLFVFFLVYLWELIAYISEKCSRAYCDCFKEEILQNAKAVGYKIKRLSTKMIKSSSMNLEQPQIELDSFAKPRRLSAVSLGEEVKIESVTERISSESINYVVNKQFISELERKIGASEKISTFESLSSNNLGSVNKIKEHILSGNVDAAQKERNFSEDSKFNDKLEISNLEVRGGS